MNPATGRKGSRVNIACNFSYITLVHDLYSEVSTGLLFTHWHAVVIFACTFPWYFFLQWNQLIDWFIHSLVYWNKFGPPSSAERETLQHAKIFYTIILSLWVQFGDESQTGGMVSQFMQQWEMTVSVENEKVCEGHTMCQKLLLFVTI